MSKEETRSLSHFSVTTVNYLVGVVFTIGCSILVVNAVLSFAPYINADFKLPAEVIYVEGGLSLASNALFLAGSTFALVRIINLESEAENQIVDSKPAGHERKGDVNDGRPANAVDSCTTTPATSTDDLTIVKVEYAGQQYSSQAAPTYLGLSQHLSRFQSLTHHSWPHRIHEMGFLGTATFLCSSFVYFSASIASIVTIVQTGEIARWIRYPQLVAGVGFAVASIMMMINVQKKWQKKWYQPAWHSFRWYVNLWNLVGSAGFIFCACFGLIENVAWARYQFGMSYLWGSWAFLFASIMQWYKSLGKDKVDRAKEWG